MMSQRPMRIVVRREVLSDPPKLVDYHSAPEAVTEELPDPYEAIRAVARAWVKVWNEREEREQSPDSTRRMAPGDCR